MVNETHITLGCFVIFVIESVHCFGVNICELNMQSAY